mgnify:CR=1 FL=1
MREEFGEISFSDRGIEGAVALRVSRDAVDALIESMKREIGAAPPLPVSVITVLK